MSDREHEGDQSEGALIPDRKGTHHICVVQSAEVADRFCIVLNGHHWRSMDDVTAARGAQLVADLKCGFAALRERVTIKGGAVLRRSSVQKKQRRPT